MSKNQMGRADLDPERSVLQKFGMKKIPQLGLIGFLTPWVMATPCFAQETEELESQLVGVKVQQADGTFMGLAVEGNALVLRFYDEDEQLISPPISRATAWWKPRNQSGRDRVVLNLAGDKLVSPPKVRPPLVFFVMLTLLDENQKLAGSFRFNLAELNP